MCLHLKWVFVGTGDDSSSVLDNFCTSDAAQLNGASPELLLLIQAADFYFMFILTLCSCIMLYSVTTGGSEAV